MFVMVIIFVGRDNEWVLFGVVGGIGIFSFNGESPALKTSSLTQIAEEDKNA